MAGSLTLAGFSTLRVPSFRAAAARRRAGAAPPRAMAAAVAAPPPPTAGRRRRGRSLYQVLQVGEAASAGEIKAAYRSMAKRVHPDVAGAGAAEGGGCGGAGPEEFLEIRRAYETLSDPTARAEYDLSIGRLGFAAAAAGFRSRRWETDQCW